MSRLGMPVSADTLIRQVKRAAHLPALPKVRVLGVDDWAWCRGQTFGTILVDLERSQVVDLLPTRSADSLGEWLAQHPEVTTVSRDRQGVYAEGARRGAPEAVQVADRFHLVLNLTQAVERELAVNRRQLRIASSSAPALPPSPTTEEVKSQSKPIQVRSSVMMQQMEVARQRRQQKLELFLTIKQMRGAGMKVNQIARQLGLCRRRIDKWIQLNELPERSRMQPRPGMPRIVPRLFTSALGGGLSAWAHVICGDSEARLRRLLLGTRKTPFAVAPGKSRDPKAEFRVPRRIAT
jgi:transposase